LAPAQVLRNRGDLKLSCRFSEAGKHCICMDWAVFVRSNHCFVFQRRRSTIGKLDRRLLMLQESIHFEGFELDPGSFELRRDGRIVKLERIPLQLLFLLAENRQRLVTREEILQDIWGENLFVDADNSINTAVRKARQALKDDPENPRFLRTVPGKGYRFTAQVDTVTSSAPVEGFGPPIQPPNEIPEAASDLAHVRPQFQKWLMWSAVGLVALVCAALVIRSRTNFPRRTSPRKVMLAVLPFVNLSGNPNEEYLADGMTEEIITQLGSLDPNLGVIARTSSMQYKGAQKGAAQVARELGVDYLLEGSVRRDEQRVRVSAQLIQASDQTHLWAADFDRDRGDVLRLQSDLALAISSKIELTLSPPTRARLKEAPPVNTAAHDAYLQGLHDWDLRTRPSVERAIAEFQTAIALDPSYAPAQAALASAYSLAPVVGAMTPMVSMTKAKEAALRAIRLDPELASGYSNLGFVKAHFEFDWAGAQQDYLRALDLNPNDAYAHMFYSNSYLSPMGRHTEAIQEMQKAIAIDPFSAPVQAFLGRSYIWARQYDKALAQFKKCAEMFPGFAINHERLAQLYAFMGRFGEAIEEDTKARLLSGEDEVLVLKKETELRQSWTASSAHGYWKQVLEFTQMPENPPEAYNSFFGTAILQAHLGDKPRALDALEKAYEQRALAMTEIAIEPAFDPIRDEPRFQELLRRVGVEKVVAKD
jgi:TolB-like protein/DNA-binding winged helix-turn-helix (wHTH) protein/Tfp pilus assembly protein PilF